MPFGRAVGSRALVRTEAIGRISGERDEQKVQLAIWERLLSGLGKPSERCESRDGDGDPTVLPFA